MLNTEAIIKTFNSIWRSKNGFKVRKVGNHILLFVFDNEEEVESIFEGEPWNFDKHLVLIRRYDNSIPVKELVFDHVSLWVQVHDIPVQFLSREVAKKLCGAVGEVRKDVNLREVERGEVMRIRVRIDVTLPRQFPSVVEEFSRRKMDRRVGSPSSTNAYQTFITGVAV